MTTRQLSDQLSTEKSKLQRLDEKVRVTRSKLDEINTEISRVEHSIAREQEDAIFHERPWPSPEAAKKLAAARTRANEETVTLRAAEGSLERQRVIVSGIEEELATRHREVLVAAIAKPRKKFLAALRALVDAGTELQQVIVMNGGCDRDTLFPPTVASDPMADVPDRQELAGLFGTVLKLASRPFYEGEAAVPYWLRQLE